MTIEEARVALDKAINGYGDCVNDGDTLEEKRQRQIADDAIDTYGDARELRGHDLLREWIERQGSLPPLARCMVCGFMDKHEAKCLVKRTLAVFPDAPVKEPAKAERN